MDIFFKLKLLNGPLRGQELRLPVGMFTLGDSDSDLRLSLERGGHATLEVSASGVFLTSSTRCWVEGRRQGVGLLPVKKGIDLDGVHFVLVDKDEEAPLQIVKKRDSGRKLCSRVLLPILLIASVVGGLLCTAPSAPNPEPHDWLPQALEAESDLHTRWLEDKSLLISGRCKDSNKLATLISRLQAHGVRLHLEAICNDDLQHSIQTLLAYYGYYNVPVTLDNKGNALIDTGLHGDINSLEKALDRLIGLSSWQVSDIGSIELEAIIKRLQDVDLLSGISAKRTEKGWLLSGKLDEQRQERLNSLLKNINQEKISDLHVRFIGVANSIEGEKYLPSPITGIGGNAKKTYLQLVNGMRLLVGTPVGDGMRVIAVYRTGISLVGNQRLLFIPLQN